MFDEGGDWDEHVAKILSFLDELGSIDQDHTDKKRRSY